MSCYVHLPNTLQNGLPFLLLSLSCHCPFPATIPFLPLSFPSSLYSASTIVVNAWKTLHNFVASTLTHIIFCLNYLYTSCGSSRSTKSSTIHFHMMFVCLQYPLLVCNTPYLSAIPFTTYSTLRSIISHSVLSFYTPFYHFTLRSIISPSVLSFHP